MTELAVALLNFNGIHHLEKYLPSVVKHSKPYDVYVIDNGSTDRSLDLLKEKFPSVKIIEFEENYGFCGGYNRALKIIQNKYVVLLNTDVEVTPNWIPPILSLFKKDNKIKAVQPKILDDKDKSKFEYAGGAGGFLDALGYPFCRGRIFEELEEDNHQYNDTTLITWASGCSLFIEREVYNAIGGLDVRYFAHMEEIDLCWRLWNAGYQVAVCPESSVYHLGGGTLDKSKPQKTYLNFRNGLSLITKNEKSINLLWKLPVRLALDLVAAIRFSNQSGWQHGRSILKAHIDFFKEFGTTYKLRPKKFSEKMPRSKKIIVWQYFILGRKKFSQISTKN